MHKNDLTNYVNDLYDKYQSLDERFKPGMTCFIKLGKKSIKHLLNNPSELSLYFSKIEEATQEMVNKIGIENFSDLENLQNIINNCTKVQSYITYSNLNMTVGQILTMQTIIFDLFLKKVDEENK